MSKLVIKVGSIEEQRELFLWRFHDVSRDAVKDLEKGNFIVIHLVKNLIIVDSFMRSIEQLLSY